MEMMHGKRAALQLSRTFWIAAIILGLQPGLALAAALTISTHTGSLLVGTLNSGAVDFTATLVSPTEATVMVDVGGGSVILTADATVSGSLIISVDLDGGGSTVTTAQKADLIWLSNELERFLKPGTGSLPGHEELLLRTAAYWAEVPVGHVIDLQTLP